MKAITIWQPWASLLTMGIKQYETRSWATSYRGPIAIHAAKKDVFDALSMIPVPVAIEMKKLIGTGWGDLPTGAVIATATLIGCHEIDRIREMRCAPQETGCWDCNHRGDWIDATPQEERFGDWTPGRYAWEFSDMRLIDPIPAKGKQGLWTWDEAGGNAL